VTTEIAQGVSPRAAGVRIIIAYKAIKAASCLLLAIALTVMLLTGYVDRAQMLATALRADLMNDWAVKLGGLMLRWLQASRLWWIVAALAAESVVVSVEAWALYRGYRWGAWLVVAATSMLVPVEVIELAHKTTIVRVGVFVVNVVIVLYLLKRAMKDHHADHPHA
jgi:uncharacterized membrane protein (DUF2068 family)